MKKKHFVTIRETIKKFLYVTGVLFACYGFWGSFFPDLTLVDGTYAIVGETKGQVLSAYEAEELYADILEGKYRVTYRSKLLELIQHRFGREYDERITK